jgi:2-polyprenyl-3-methyl-5-hydroxy-6-metoxy-1,4-benzoquinol methylase
MSKASFCPICNESDTSSILRVKDFSVSGEIFDLHLCNHCQFLFTAQPPTPENIGRYYQSEDYISHTDSNEGLFNKVYQLVRRFTLRSKHNLIVKYAELSRPGRLLDYGCGTGAFIKEMQKGGWNVLGIEPVKAARSRAASQTNTVVIDPSDIHVYRRELFDVITLWHVLEHVHDLHATLDKLSELLSLGGLMVIAVPNHTSVDAKYYGEYWAAYDVPRHLYHFNSQSLHLLLKRHGLSVAKILPMWFDSFYVSLLSEKYKQGKMKMIQAVLIGFYSNLVSLFKPCTCSSQIYIVRKSNFSK